MDPITSLHNPRVKAAAKLRDRRARDEQGRILIDGTREIALAVAAGVKIVEVFAAPELCTSAECRDLLTDFARRDVGVVSVSPAVFAKLAYGARAEGILAVAEPPVHELNSLRLPDRALVAVLEGLEKPGNVGAVLRSADAAGVAAVIVADPHTDLYNPNCIRASLGTIFSLPVFQTTSGKALEWLRKERIEIYAARVDAPADYRQLKFANRAAIVLGSEAAGLSPQWQGPGVTPIKLPMQGAADSLNVSATAAVLFYEALRQRGT